MKFLGVSRNGDSHKGFTLTEILIALAVVGIIAVLILPVITSRAQNRGFSLSYDAEVREIMNSLEGLTLNENVKSFDKTIMNVDSARAAANAGDERSAANEIHNVEGTAGQFLRKYTKVAKYCGATSVGCFAQTYFKYNDRNREGFILENIISGQEQYTVTVDGVETSLDFSHMACAILKNGMSLCISPQVRNPLTGDLRRPVRGFIDLNGPKEPNVLGRDLRSFSMDLATRTITAPEASNVIIPDTPPVCQDGECCEEKFANGELAERDLSAPKDACCATLIASQGLGAVLPYCCSTSDTSPECCNYMKGKVNNVDELPAACKPEPERTPCEKLALGDASQLAACCNDKNNQYWKEDGHDWDQTCCSLQEDQCCDNKYSKIWTAQNPWAGSCCGKYPNDPLCSAECSAEKWEDACCETVDHGSSIWRENCCSLEGNKNDKNCCKSDGLNVHNKFRTVCCLNKDGIDKLGQSRNIDCCYQSKWEEDCCAAAESKIGTGEKDKNKKIWENHCCSQAKYMDEDYCCKDGKNKYGNGSYTENCCGLMDNKYSYAYANHCCSIIDDSSSDYADYCCDSSTTYDWDNPCCNIHKIGCPNTCEDDGYYDRNIIDCCKSNFNEGKCCALDVYTNDSRCCSDGKNADGEYTQTCCSSSASSTDSKIACCNKAWLHKDVCCADDIKGSQFGYDCTEPLSCDNIYEDYKKVKKGELSPTSSRGKEVKQYWTENSCCDLTQYKNDPIVCPQPPQDPCPFGRGSLDVVHKKPNLNLPDSDVYFVGWNFSEYNNKNITVKLSQVDYRFIKLDAGGACIWSSERRSVYGLTFSANVVNNGFTVGHDLNVPDRPAGSKVEILDFVRRSGDQSVILVDGEIPACIDKGTVKDHIPCPEPSTQCTPNTLTLKYTSRGRGDAGCTVSANTITYSIEAERPVDDNVTVQLKYYKQHFNRDGSDAGIEDIYKTLTISKGSKTSSSVTEIQNICPAGSIAGCITDSCYNAYGVNRIFGAEISHIASFSNSDCYPLIGGTDATCPSLSVATPMDVTSQCCKEWGESAVNNVSPSIGIKDKCCQYPDIAEQWVSCKNSCTPNSVTLNIEPTESCAHTWYFKVKPPLTGTHQNSIPTYSYNITNHTESGVCKGTPSVEFEYIDVYSHTCGCTSGNPVGNPVSCKYCSNPNSKDCKDMTSPATCQNSYDAMCPGRDPFSTSNCSYGRYYDQYSHPMRTIAHVMTTVNGVKREVKKFESSSSQGNAYYQYDFEGGIQDLTLSFKSAAPVTEDVTIKVEYYIVHYNNDGSFNRKEGPKSQTFKIQKNKTESNKVTLSQDWTKQIVDLQVVSSEDPCYPVSNTWNDQAPPPGAEPDPTCSYTSFDGPEDGCCLTAPSHNDAWYSGCCSADSTDPNCCEYRVGADGSGITDPNDKCCTLHLDLPQCQTPCDKVKNGPATEADKKACCQDENNSIWTTNKAWADACCTLTDDYGNYSYKDDNSKAAMCCSAWVKNDLQIIIYNPSEYDSSDGKSGYCNQFDEDWACIQEHFDKADISACTISCYDDKGNPDSQYIHPFCCNLWKTDDKLNNDVKGACCTALQEHDPVWEDFCSTDTCPPNADNASAKCCSEWMPKLPNGGIVPISNEAVLGACCKNDEWVQVDSSQKGFCCRISEHSSYAPCGGGGSTPTPSGNCYATVKLTCKLVPYFNIMCPNYRIQCKLVNETENCKVNNLSVLFGVSSKTSSPNNTGNCIDSSMSAVSKQGVSNFEEYKDIGISGNQFYIDGSCKFEGYDGYSEIKGLNKLNCGSCSGFYDSTYFNTWAQGNANSELKCTNSKIIGTSQ